MPGGSPRLLEVPLFEGTNPFIPRDEECIQVEIIMTKHMFVNLPAVLENAMHFCHETVGRIGSCCFDLGAAVMVPWLPLALVAQQMVGPVE